jgi:hypothetical protein
MPTDHISSTLTTLAQALEGISFPSATFLVDNGELQLLNVSNIIYEIDAGELTKKLTITPEQLEEKIKVDGEIFNVTEDSDRIP